MTSKLSVKNFAVLEKGALTRVDANSQPVSLEYCNGDVWGLHKWWLVSDCHDLEDAMKTTSYRAINNS